MKMFCVALWQVSLENLEMQWCSEAKQPLESDNPSWPGQKWVSCRGYIYSNIAQQNLRKSPLPASGQLPEKFFSRKNIDFLYGILCIRVTCYMGMLFWQKRVKIRSPIEHSVYSWKKHFTPGYYHVNRLGWNSKIQNKTTRKSWIRRSFRNVRLHLTLSNDCVRLHYTGTVVCTKKTLKKVRTICVMVPNT